MPLEVSLLLLLLNIPHGVFSRSSPRKEQRARDSNANGYTFSGSSAFEASGLVPFNLTCSSAPTGQNCTSSPVDISREFTSLQPRPAGAVAQ